MVALFCGPLNCVWLFCVLFYKGDQNSSHLGEKMFARVTGKQPINIEPRLIIFQGALLWPIPTRWVLFIIYSQTLHVLCLLHLLRFVMYCFWNSFLMTLSLDLPLHATRDHGCGLRYLRSTRHRAQNVKACSRAARTSDERWSRGCSDACDDGLYDQRQQLPHAAHRTYPAARAHALR